MPACASPLPADALEPALEPRYGEDIPSEDTFGEESDIGRSARNDGEGVPQVEESHGHQKIVVEFSQVREGSMKMRFSTNPASGEHEVTEVIEGGMAEQWGIRKDDRLVAYNGKRLEGMSERAVTQHIKGAKCGKLELIRWVPQRQKLGTTYSRGKSMWLKDLDGEGILLVDFLDLADRGNVTELASILENHSQLDVNKGDYDRRSALHLAAAGGHPATVAYLLWKGADFRAKDRWGQTALDGAAPGPVRTILSDPLRDWRQHFPSSKEKSGGSPGTPSLANNGANVRSDNDAVTAEMLVAASKGDLRLLQTLVTCGADCSKVDDRNMTALDHACNHGYEAMVDFLLHQTRTVVNRIGGNNPEKDRSPLGKAREREARSLETTVKQKYKRIELLLTKHGATELCTLEDKDQQNDVRSLASELCTAAADNDLQSLQDGKLSAAELSVADYDGRTALHLAASEGRLAIVEWLLKNRVSANVVDRVHHTPLDDAFMNQQSKMGYDGVRAARIAAAIRGAGGAKWEEMCERGWNKDRKTPLYWALVLGEKAKAEVLIANVSDVNSPDADGSTPLHWAAESGQKEMVELLLAKGSNVNKEDNNGSTPLHWAAEGGHKEVVEMLLAMGSEVSAKDQRDYTALHSAVMNGHKEVVMMLVAKADEKADGAAVDYVNAVNKDGKTTLHFAAMFGKKEIAEVLTDKGGDANAKDQHRRTPLYWAAVFGQKEVTEMLVEKGADVNAADKNGETPLHLWAAVRVNSADNEEENSARARSQSEMVEMLIAHGAKVDARDKDGSTALHRALERRADRNMVERLTQNGADVDIPNEKGMSPLDTEWEKDPSSDMTLLLLKSSAYIAKVFERHLFNGLGAQLGNLLKECDELNDQEWLGTGKRGHGHFNDGLWVKGENAAVALLVQMLNEAQSSVLIPLFEKLLVPCRDTSRMMYDISEAKVDSRTRMLIYPAADWPDTYHYLADRRTKEARRYHRLGRGQKADADDRDTDAVPVNGFVFALKGFLSNRDLLEAIGDYSGSMDFFKTDAVLCLDQYHWQNWGKTEFRLRLIEYVCYTASTMSWCWLVAEETEGLVYEVPCTGMVPCYEWSAEPLPDLQEQPLWMLVLDAVVVLWSGRYLLEQLVDAIQLYRAAQREQRLLWAQLDEGKSDLSASRRTKDALSDAGEKGKEILRVQAGALLTAATGQERWLYVGYVSHSLAIAAVVLATGGSGKSYYFLTAVLVLLLMLLLLGYMRGFRHLSTSVNMVGYVFWDLQHFFVLFALALFAFAFAFHLLLPGTEGFFSLEVALSTTWNTLLLTHDIETYPTKESKLFLGLFLLLSAIVLLNMIISILGDTYDRHRDTYVEQGTRQRLQLLARMRRSPLQLRKAWWALWGTAQQMVQDEQGYMIVLKAVGASDGESNDGEWTGRIRMMKNEIKKQGNQQRQQIEELKRHIEEIRHQMSQQTADLQQRERRTEEQVTAVLAALQRG